MSKLKHLIKRYKNIFFNNKVIIDKQPLKREYIINTLKTINISFLQKYKIDLFLLYNGFFIYKLNLLNIYNNVYFSIVIEEKKAEIDLILKTILNLKNYDINQFFYSNFLFDQLLVEEFQHNMFTIGIVLSHLDELRLINIKDEIAIISKINNIKG